MASIIDLDRLSDDNLKKRVLELISIDDWMDECSQCRNLVFFTNLDPVLGQRRRMIPSS